MTDVFIAYRSTERSAVAPLARALEESGYSVWWDEQLQVSSNPYPRQIEMALLGAKTVIVCWSPEALSSDWVIAEASAAREVGKLIQVKIRACALPPPFNVLETADLSNWNGDRDNYEWKRVVDGVAALVNRPPGPSGKRNDLWRLLRVPAAVVCTALIVMLLVFQNTPTICEWTGWSCHPAAVGAPTVPSDKESVPHIEARSEKPTAECTTPRLARMLEQLKPALGRASVRICAEGSCGLSAVKLNELVRFEISSTVSGTIVAFDIDESGNHVQLLPDREIGDFKIQAGKVRRVPGEREFRASEAERGCVLAIVGPSRGAFGKRIEREEVLTRAFKLAPETVRDVASVVADAHEADPTMKGWAFGWASYEVRP